MKKAIVFSFLVVLFLMSACDDNNATDKTSQLIETESIKESIGNVVENDDGKKQKVEGSISFQQYSELIDNLSSNLKIPGYNLENSTLGDDITMIDKDISFNKREYLSIDGNYSPTKIESSQETLFYLNEEKDRAFIITVAFTNSSIGNDIIFYNITNDYGLPEEISNNNDLITLSYKNLVISILQSAKDSVEKVDTLEAARTTVKFFENLE